MVRSGVDTLYCVRFLTGGAFDPYVVPPCTVGSNQAKLNTRTEFKILERSLKGGGVVMHIAVYKT